MLAVGTSTFRGALSALIAGEFVYYCEFCDRLFEFADRADFCGVLSLGAIFTSITLEKILLV